MKTIHAIMALCVALVGLQTVGITEGCTPAEQHTANTIINGGLQAADFICIEAGDFADAPAAAFACGIISGVQKLAPELEAFIESLLSQSKALKAAGYKFDKPTAKWVK